MKGWLYKYILDGIQKEFDLDDEGLKNYLEGQKDNAKKLWDSFRSNVVKVDYSKEDTQVSYLIRYFPHYAQMLFDVLRSHKGIVPFFKKVMLFGAGPCPEIIGYVKSFGNDDYLDHFSEPVEFHIYDIWADEWKWSQDFIQKHILANISKYACNIHRHKIDISISNALASISLDDTPTLIIFQNCLNEIPIAFHGNVIHNVTNLLESVPNSSLLIISDLENYSSSQNLAKGIEIASSKIANIEIIRSISGAKMEITSTHAIPPDIIRKHFLTGENGLMSRKYIKFNYLLLRKK